MSRLAAIDVGTNTVLLLVAERRGDRLFPLLERAEITRLGRGVDATAVPVAVIVAGVPTPAAVAVSVFVPAVVPSVQLPTVATPFTSVVSVATVT
jgi:hypothetical protein